MRSHVGRARAPWLALIVIVILSLALIILPHPAEGAVGSWSRLDLNGLQVTALTVDPGQPNTLFAGSFGQGIYRSTDRGQNWTQVNTGLGNLFVNEIVVDPANGNNLLAATGRGAAVGEGNAGVYRSTDRGSTWTRVLEAGTISALAVTPQNPRVVYAAGGPPVFKSVDGGATWSPAFQPGADIVNVDMRGITVDSNNANVILAAGNTEGGQGQLFRSANAGASWDRVLADQAAILDVEFVTDLRLGVVAFFGNLVGVFRSTDEGLTWQRVSEEMGDITVRRMAPNPSAAEEISAATDRGVIRTTNLGTDWSVLDSSLGNQDVHSLAYDRSGQQTLFAGTSDGVWDYTFPRAPTPGPATPAPVTPTPTPPASTWFFAEGSTQQPFQTWFLVQNPTANPASVRFTFQLEGGGIQSRDITVGPNSRFSLFANQVLPDAAFSTRVDSNQQVFVERSIFVGFDGSVITGIASANRNWLFAEGATVQPFHTWVLIQNPNSVPATTLITYQLRDRPPVVQSLGALPPTSRTSVFVNQVLPNEEFSVRVDSDQPVIAERAMFRFPGNAATAVSGATESSRIWYFAEGSSIQTPPRPTDSFLLLQNPNQVPSSVNITLFGILGQQPRLQITLPPNSRRTVFLNDVFANASFGIRVESSEPIVAERSQFFGPEPRGATASVGATALATQWNLPEGSTQQPFTTAIAILNPNPDAMSARIDFQLENGQVVTREFTVGPTRKLSINVNDLLPNNAFSARVITSIPSVVERTMAFAKPDGIGFTNTVGISR